MHRVVPVFRYITVGEKKNSKIKGVLKFSDAETQELFCPCGIRQLVFCSTQSGGPPATLEQTPHTGRSGEPSLEQGPADTGYKQDEAPKPAGPAGSGAGPEHGLGPEP